MVLCPAFDDLNGIERALCAPPEAMDEAMRLPDGVGVILALDDPRAARRYRDQCYNARRRAMRHARKLPPEDAAYCRTPWDPLVFVVGRHYVWVGKLAAPSQQQEAAHVAHFRLSPSRAKTGP